MSVNPSYCVPFVTNGCTFGGNCSRRHDIFKCSCGRILLEEYRKPHTKGNAHRQALQAIQKSGAQIPKSSSTSSVPRNRAGRSSRRSATAQYAAARQESSSSSPVQEQLVCEHCRRKVDNADYDAHVEGHMQRQRMDDALAELEEAKNDKEGVVVSGRNGIDFGILAGDCTVEIGITITSTLSAVSLNRCRVESSTRKDEHGVKFSARLRGKGRVIPKGATRHLSVVFHPSYAGKYDDNLALVFFDLEKRSTFVITRSVAATVGDAEDHEQLKAKAPYKRRRIFRINPIGTVVPSMRPPTWSKTPWVDKLLPFYPPERLIKMAFGPPPVVRQAYTNVKKHYMPAVFNENTYAWFFQTLLYLEEHQVKLNLEAYSLSDVELKADYPRYKLLVEGLAENRPSVLVGDFIHVSHHEPPETLNTNRTWYEGRVHKVHEKHVTLLFGENFSTYKGTKFDVRFVLNRLPFRRMHQALVNKVNPKRLLFPEPAHIQGVTRVSAKQMEDISPANRLVKEDEEQLETVAAILNQAPGSVPFVVFGPPGTGKTITIVEAMNQILDRDPNARILACAPNNSAADLIAMKLMNRGASQIYRLNALSRKLDDMDQSLHRFSSINDNLVFAMPDKESLQKFRVVVSTCLSAGVPASLGLKRGHFSHIFIDEAGQGKEPELMIPIKSIADDKTNVVLAGDNQQLGPIINSSLASSLGLKLSYLARIMQREIYDLAKYKGITIVKLIKNFRSHPDILRFSNEQFYNSELQTCGNVALTHSLVNYEELPKKQFPLMFHSVVGKDEREASSPSFFNIIEATQVKKYCISLITNRKNNIKAEHIGVITPYHAQRCKILDLLHKDVRFRDIKVGSVEEFQGQERRVIIISTVRSNTDYVTSDIRRSLGFVANKSRMNVALTRAQALLIVVGNPTVLSLDPLWRSFLNYIHSRGGWRGKEIDWDPKEPVYSDGSYDATRKSQAEAELEDTIAKLRAMVIQKHEDDGFEIDNEDDEDQDAAAFERPILREAE